MIGFLGDLEGYLPEFVAGHGIGVKAGLEGVEVALGDAGGARAELMVEMGAAVIVLAHGPGAATGGLAMLLVGVSRHGISFHHMIAQMFESAMNPSG